MSEITDIDTIAKDITVDVLIVGSGTGMAAALAANQKGLKALVIEKTNYVGGSTARSGGGFWIPANPTLLADGSTDNLLKAEQYLDAIIHDTSLKPRWKKFLENGYNALNLLKTTTDMEFFWSKGYPDYHPENPGGDVLGRTCECKPFNIKKLGKNLSRLRPGIYEAPLPMPVTGYDYKWLNLMVKVPFKAFPIIFKRLFQGVFGLIFGKKMVAGGQALAAGMFDGLIKAKIPVWTNTEMIEILTNDDKVTGLKAIQNEKTVTITVKKAIILATGGFDHNMQMRHQFQSKLLQNISMGAEGNTGDGIILSEKIGGYVKNMKESWWFPVIANVSGGDVQVLLAERSLPGSFIIDENGKRFVNESIDYMSYGQAVLHREEIGNPIKEMWFIFDQKYRNSYVLAGLNFPAMPLPKKWYEDGIAFSAKTPSELATKVGLPVGAFEETFERFNTLCKKAEDNDFNRGKSIYDNYYGDPTQKPNPNLRPLKGNLYAVKLVLSDLGTCGGLATNADCQVLNKNENPIKGLYAIGNTAANMFGKVYPGAGGTICQGLVSGYIAVQHIANENNIT